MRYLSLFSGIGGFEVAIQQVYGKKAECVAYSEIDKHAIKEYERHYPDHKNLGDVTLIKKKDIDDLGKIELIVGGFPCSDLSSAKHKGRLGLDGDKSGLFWIMIKIMKWVKKNNPDVKILVENNASMAHRWRDMITSELTKLFKKPVYCNYFDSSQWVVQRRRRYYWTFNNIPENKTPRKQTMKDILAPMREARKYAISSNLIDLINRTPSHLMKVKKGKIISKVNNCYTLNSVHYGTRLSMIGSCTKNNYIRCIETSHTFTMIMDYRLCPGKDTFIPRHLTKSEYNALFGYPDNYVETDFKTVYARLYGMTVVPPVIVYILQNLEI